jgi:cell division protein FtsN
MADRPPAKSKAPTEPTKKETADERRQRQRELVISTQIDLKREAAERRERKLKG